MIRINKNLALFSGLLLLSVSLLLFILQKFSPLLDHVAYYCKSFITTNMVPVPYYLSIIPAMFLVIIIAISIIKFFVLLIKVEFLKRTLKGKITVESTVSKLIHRLGLAKQTIIIKSKKKFAFCLGIKTQKIYLSTGLIAHLSLEEIEAVLRHEQYHLEKHDTFTMLIASVTYSLFPFFPILGDLIQKYRIEREIEADQFAVQKIGSTYPLIGALKKLLAFPTVETVALASIADADTLEPRIYSLLNKRYIKKQLRLKHLIVTLASLFLLGAVIVLPVQAKEIHHEAHDVVMICTDKECISSCTSENNLHKLYSEIPSHSYTPAP